jgi:hypothetical protein
MVGWQDCVGSEEKNEQRNSASNILASSILNYISNYASQRPLLHKIIMNHHAKNHKHNLYRVTFDLNARQH